MKNTCIPVCMLGISQSLFFFEIYWELSKVFIAILLWRFWWSILALLCRDCCFCWCLSYGTSLWGFPLKVIVFYLRGKQSVLQSWWVLCRFCWFSWRCKSPPRCYWAARRRWAHWGLSVRCCSCLWSRISWSNQVSSVEIF